MIRHLLGEATEAEKVGLEHWLAESEDNRMLWERLTSPVFLDKVMGDRNREMRDKVWEHLQLRMKRPSVRKRRMYRLRTVAAVLVLALGGLAVVWLLRNGNPDLGEAGRGLPRPIQAGRFRAFVELAGGKQVLLENDTTLYFENQGVHLVSRQDTLNLVSSCPVGPSANGLHSIRIPRGGEYIARLEDGSVVYLNADTEVRVPTDFGSGNRQVWLKGEAFFSVAHEPEHPFTVHTEKADISVWGTEFDVRAYGEEPEMLATLVEGSVRVSSGKASGLLKPGEQARVDGHGAIGTARVNVYRFIAWKIGRMVFEGERLERIMTELQRWYNFEVFYANPGLKELRFTIDILKYDDLSKVLELLEKTEKVKIVQKGRAVLLSEWP